MKKLNVSVGRIAAGTETGAAGPGAADGASAATREARVLPEPERKRVAYGLIRPDPGQPRKTFEAGALESLAADIKVRGIITDLVLEFVPAEYRLLEPDLTNAKWRLERLEPDGSWTLLCEDEEQACRGMLSDLATYAPQYQTPPPGGAWPTGGTRPTVTADDLLLAHYRIVCGERRWRAAGMAGLAELPARVYTGLTAEQRFGLQWVENTQRENVGALEEAGALAKQLEERRRGDASFSPEKLAAELNMSRAGLYERLKLHRLMPEIREALLAGTISVSIAGEMAKLPTAAMQRKLLKELATHTERFGAVSVRDVQDRIDADYIKQLDAAPFDQGVAMLVDWPDLNDVQVRQDCKGCQYRSGNMVAEFPDLAKRPNVCTRPDCFGQKCRLHWLEQAQTEAQKGKTVLTEKEFRANKKNLVAGKQYRYGQNKQGTMEELMGKNKPEPVLVATAEGLETYYPKEEALAAAKKNGVKFRVAAKSLSPAEKKAAEEKEKALETLRKARQQLVDDLAASLAKGLAKLPDKEMWALVRKSARENYGWGEALQAAVKTDRDFVVAGLLYDAHRAVVGWKNGAWNEEALALWKRLGVDLVAEEAKRAPKLEVQPKQKTLNPTTKAKIGAAQKARWAKVQAAK